MATLLRTPNNRTDAPRARRTARGVEPLVLVVEDHDDTCVLLKCVLERRGCRVAIAADGEAAVRVAEGRRPDLILMDASLPRLDGLAATRRIREQAALRDVPIVFLSGHAQPSFRAEAVGTGGTDYLVKPFELAQLEVILERHLGEAAASRAD